MDRKNTVGQTARRLEPCVPSVEGASLADCIRRDQRLGVIRYLAAALPLKGRGNGKVYQDTAGIERHLAMFGSIDRPMR